MKTRATLSSTEKQSTRSYWCWIKGVITEIFSHALYQMTIIALRGKDWAVLQNQWLINYSFQTLQPELWVYTADTCLSPTLHVFLQDTSTLFFLFTSNWLVLFLHALKTWLCCHFNHSPCGRREERKRTRERKHSNFIRAGVTVCWMSFYYTVRHVNKSLKSARTMNESSSCYHMVFVWLAAQWPVVKTQDWWHH